MIIIWSADDRAGQTRNKYQKQNNYDFNPNLTKSCGFNDLFKYISFAALCNSNWLQEGNIFLVVKETRKNIKN